MDGFYLKENNVANIYISARTDPECDSGRLEGDFLPLEDMQEEIHVVTYVCFS